MPWPGSLRNHAADAAVLVTVTPLMIRRLREQGQHARARLLDRVLRDDGVGEGEQRSVKVHSRFGV